MGTENRKGPLKDVKVLDFTIALAGVYVAWQFADMGAEVWKVLSDLAGQERLPCFR